MYCNVVWGPCCQSYLNNLNTIQKKIIRIMSFKGKFEHTAPLFNDFNVLTIGNINKYMCLLPSRIREIISYETFKFNVKKLLLLEQN